MSSEEELKRTKELNDKFEKIFEEKYQGKNFHNTPAPETLIRLKNLEDNYKQTMEKLDSLIISVAELPEKILEKADSRYASKDTEETVSTMYKTVSEFTGLKTWIGIIFSLFLVIGGTMGYLFAQNIISEANKYADKILKEQSEQTRKIITAEVLNSLKTYDKIIIKN